MDEEEEKKKFETEENQGKEKKRLNKEALCERLTKDPTGINSCFDCFVDNHNCLNNYNKSG